MKNKKNIYILLPIVLLVWGAVLFQVFSFTNRDDILPENNQEFIIKAVKVTKREKIAINVNYRDPFLGKTYASQTALKTKNTNPKISTVKKPEAVVWPNIFYKGLIADSKGGSKIYMIIIDNKNYYMKIGDTESEIFLKSGDKESIYVRYKGNLNIIMLQD
ncbi:hypothetical protein [Flavobacterium reichenbachii]|uniref:hypothetical protein n=1 Tax=Flavobacterium reichenbachii TaxID=362418 RepID=UPI000B5BC0E7|nr:hypothetical protein [Flavobacterium reichenbachii]OXB15786.1 hypothetical protein B0A68_08970 [Flavobacterium reichenbachii]